MEIKKSWEKCEISRKFIQTVEMSQEKDCCDCENIDYQILEIITQDGGGGQYLVIKTDRWAIDPNDIDAFCGFLKETLAMVDDPNA